MTQTQPKKTTAEIFEQIKQAVMASWERMQQTWKQSIEDASINPQATYQKPLFHQTEPERGILYELPKSKRRRNLIDEEALAKRIYRPSPVGATAKATAKPPQNTLYDVTYPNHQASSLYNSTDNEVRHYPNPLNVGYQKNDWHPHKSSKPKRIYAPSNN